MISYKWCILKEQELVTLLEHLSSPPVFSGVRVTRSLVLCLCFVLFLLAIVVCSFRFMDSDYPFGIFKLFLKNSYKDSSFVLIQKNIAVFGNFCVWLIETLKNLKDKSLETEWQLTSVTHSYANVRSWFAALFVHDLLHCSVTWDLISIYNVAEILLKLALNTNQSIFWMQRVVILYLYKEVGIWQSWSFKHNDHAYINEVKVIICMYKYNKGCAVFTRLMFAA